MTATLVVGRPHKLHIRVCLMHHVCQAQGVKGPTASTKQLQLWAFHWLPPNPCASASSQVVAKNNREQLRAMLLDVTSGTDKARYKDLLE